MPELIEVEVYRQVADAAIGRTIEAVSVPDAWFLKGGITPSDVIDALGGATVAGTSRVGKLLTMDLGPQRPVLGLRFGMTGRLEVDGTAPITQLEYASNRDEPEWDRFAVQFADGGRLRLSDPRRLGGVELDPDLGRLGPDAWHISPGQLRTVLEGSRAPLKARLLDQACIAGLGNLLVDETLWRARLDPARPSGGLSAAERRRLAGRITSTIDDLFERGGSHRGDLQDSRHRDGACPRCASVLERRQVGGRTTYSCPGCQPTSKA